MIIILKGVYGWTWTISYSSRGSTFRDRKDEDGHNRSFFRAASVFDLCIIEYCTLYRIYREGQMVVSMCSSRQTQSRAVIN